MSRNNDVSRVLVTSGNVAVLAAGSDISALAIGQIGVFDAETGVAIDGSSPKRNFFLAVGLDRDGDASMDDIKQSSGQYIQRTGVKFYQFREHSAPQPQIGLIGDYKGDCDTEYAVKFEFRDQEIYRTQGFNQFTKTYAIQTDCCDDCATCPSGDANEITQKLLAEIALDETPMITAVAVARQAIVTATVNAATATYDMTTVDPAAGDPLVAADLLAMIEWNALQPDETTKLFSDVEYTTVQKAVNAYCTVNLKYFHPRGIVALVSLVDGFNCNGVTSISQTIAFEEGAGYDIAQKEWHNSGNAQNSPYVLSDATGVPPALDSFAVKTAKYDQFSLEYDLQSESGWLEYNNNLSTIIAVPVADTVTRNSVATVLDAQLLGLGFDPKADDAAAANVGPTVVSPTTDIDDVDLDGIG
jgi:hypothetical protein